jgi:hypothetical protein
MPIGRRQRSRRRGIGVGLRHVDTGGRITMKSVERVGRAFHKTSSILSGVFSLTYNDKTVIEYAKYS